MITLNDIQSALGRIRASIYLSPCALSATFSESTANQVYLKLDNLQRTGAFKERGALNKLLSLSPAERAQGVIAASAGNHAQGVAYHAGKLGIRAQICMPLTTPLSPEPSCCAATRRRACCRRWWWTRCRTATSWWTNGEV